MSEGVSEGVRECIRKRTCSSHSIATALTLTSLKSVPRNTLSSAPSVSNIHISICLTFISRSNACMNKSKYAIGWQSE